MIKKLSTILFVAVFFGNGSAEAQTPSLKDVFKKDFLIGTAMNAQQIEEKDTAADRLIKQQFNAVTPENCMKAEEIHPGGIPIIFALPINWWPLQKRITSK